MNFNVDGALTVPISDVKKMLVMEKREAVIQAFQRLYENGDSGDHDEIQIIRSKVIALFLELQKFLQEFYKDEFVRIKSCVFSYDLKWLRVAFDLLDDKIYKLVEANKETIL